MQLKSLIKKIAVEKRISAQLVMQNYVMERFLERISLSAYRENFILKGGFLISAIVGLDTRTTMDLDTTVKGFSLTHESLKKIFKEICNIAIEDDITSELLNTIDIRETDDYPGIRVNLKANYSPISVPFTVDVTTGDKITPREIEYDFPLMFSNKKFTIMVYPLETVLAEKVETVISRGVANTRLRDFYDIYILWKLHSRELKMSILKEAVLQTAKKRGSVETMEHYDSILMDILGSIQMQSFWEKYQKDNEYARNITFKIAVYTINEILDRI